jgi:hypothetical protein
MSVTVTKLEIVKLINRAHVHVTSASAWSTIDGCQHVVTLNNDAEVEIIAHSHAKAFDSNRRVDLG